MKSHGSFICYGTHLVNRARYVAGGSSALHGLHLRSTHHVLWRGADLCRFEAPECQKRCPKLAQVMLHKPYTP